MLVEAPGIDGGSTGSDGGGGSSATSSSTANSNSTSSHLSTSTNKSSSSCSEGKGGMNGRAPIDVEARLAYTPPHVLIRSISSLSQHSIRPRTPEPQEDGVVPTLRKGVLFQARDRLFSRWKERYFVLTRDYLACFRRGSTKYSEMGSFIFKVNLASVETVDWQDRRGGPVLAITLPREGRVLLRAKSGLEQWYRLLLDATMASRQRRNALKRGTSTTHLNHLSAHFDQISSSPLGALQYSLSDSTPEIAQLCDSVSSETSPRVTTLADRSHRFSLMSEVDVGSYSTDVATPPSSVTSSHKFSSSTSNTSGSGGSSSLASSPSLRGPWPRPSSPIRPLLGDVAPRSRFSLYEGPREAAHSNAKTRYSVCVEPRELNSDLTPSRRRFPGLSHARHSICAEPKELTSSRISLSMEPRNPLLDLLESVETAQFQAKQKKTSLVISGKVSSPAKSVSSQPTSSPQQLPPPTRDAVETSPSPPSARHRPRAQSTSVTSDHTALTPRSRTNLALFRHSALFN